MGRAAGKGTNQRGFTVQDQEGYNSWGGSGRLWHLGELLGRELFGEKVWELWQLVQSWRGDMIRRNWEQYSIWKLIRQGAHIIWGIRKYTTAGKGQANAQHTWNWTAGPCATYRFSDCFFMYCCCPPFCKFPLTHVQNVSLYKNKQCEFLLWKKNKRIALPNHKVSCWSPCTSGSERFPSTLLLSY